MSISAAHSEAARQNGALSNGPVTDAGRERSSQNARKHNIFGSTLLLPEEDQAAFAALSAAYMDEFQPASIAEAHYVREMVDAEWRLQRTRQHAACLQSIVIRALSANPTPIESAHAFHTITSESNSLPLLLRYENQFRRQYDKSLEQFLRLRAQRDKNQAQDEKERKDQEQKATAQRQRNAEEQLAILQAIIEAPTPGQLHGYAAAATPQAASNSNPINLQNEPIAPTVTDVCP